MLTLLGFSLSQPSLTGTWQLGSGATRIGIAVRRARLSWTRLSWTRLSWTRLSWTRLSWTRLSGGRLSGSRLSETCQRAGGGSLLARPGIGAHPCGLGRTVGVG
jgi:uncharacterized protein YjbI with pentapeptide repeats